MFISAAAYRSWLVGLMTRAFLVLVATPGSTWVPTPSSVKSSSRTACGSRPSTTVARGTPPCTAWRQAPIFGTMPGGQRRHQLGQRLGADLADHVVAVGPVAVEALDVGEHQQLLGAQRHREGGRGGVGVDVVHDAVLVGRDAGDDRDAAGLDQVEHRLGPDLGDLADQAEVDLLAVDDGVGAPGGEQARRPRRRARPPAGRAR